ncbi:MAG: hydrogen peroxide-inducible genes activator [Flavobacteriales bacterium]|nr:hydrogen peroxide-inducible genes activator [Flavobacteriales bacterium]
MTLIQLQYVLSVAEYKNFTVAAEKSYVTQPTLSMQIQKLERELDSEIFDRTTHPITITPIGLKVIEQAKVILAEAKKMGQMVMEEKESLEGTLTIGIIPTIFSSLVPLFYKTIKKNFPKTRLIIKEMKTEDIIESFNERELDFAIAATPLDEPQIIEKPIYYEPLVAYIPENHKLHKEKYINISQIAENELLLLGEGHCFRNNVLTICGSNQVNRGDLQSGDFSTLVKLSNEGFGITILPLLYVENLSESEKKCIRYFKENNNPTREISLLHHDTQVRLHFRDEFYKLIQGIIRGMLFLESNNVTSPKLKLS